MLSPLPSDICRRWTPTAVYCYSIGCKCSICPIAQEHLTLQNRKCKMRYVVRELVRKIGKPKEI